MAVMNELLEEAVAQCTAVSQQVADATEALGALIDRADHLRELLASEAGQASHLCQDLAARLADAEHGLEDAGRGAGSHLQELETRAGEVQQHVSHLLAAVHRDVSDLETHRDQLLSSLDPQVETAAADLQHLAQHIQDVESATDHHLQEAEQAILAFTDTVTEARQELDERHNGFQHALTELETAVGEQVHALTDAVHATLADQATHLVEAANRMLTEHNQAVVAVRKAFAEEAKEQIASAAAPLRDAMQALGELCAHHESTLKDDSQAVLDRVHQALRIMDEIKPALESANRLL